VKTEPAALPTGPDEITCTFTVLKSFKLQKGSGHRQAEEGRRDTVRRIKFCNMTLAAESKRQTSSGRRRWGDWGGDVRLLAGLRII